MACIRRRRDKWVVDYRVGQQRKTPSFANRAEAEAFKRNLLLRPIDRISGFETTASVLVSDATRKYLEIVTPTKSPRTYEVDRISLGGFAEVFGQVTVSDLTLQELESYQLQLSKHLRSATVNRRFNTIRHFFRKCEDWGYIQRSPTLRLAKLKEEPSIIKVWSDGDIQKVIQAAHPWAADIIYLIAKTGMRRGEAANLTWDCVDFDNKVVHVKSLKGGKARLRIIPMTDELFDFFLDKRNRSRFVVGGGNRVFLNAQNKPIMSAHLSTEMNRAAKRTGLEKMRLHGLRHTILTKLARGNHSLEKIKLLAGHSSIRTTERYLHLQNEDLRGTLETLEETDKIARIRKV